MAPKKRQPEPTSDSEQDHKEEKAEQQDSKSDSKPPAKKQKQSDSKDEEKDKKASSTSSNEKPVSKQAAPHTEKAASKGEGAPGSHPNQSDYNPNRGKLPKDKTPTDLLNETLKKHEKSMKDLEKQDGNVMYWMRMRDIRTEDNRALSNASQLAQKRGSNLVVLHILSPEDLKAHDTSARKTDFLLRNLRDVKSQFDSLDIPMMVLNLSENSESRASIVEKVIEVAQEVGATSILANKEFEVNELWRDVRLIEKITKENGDSLSVNLYEDTYVVPPGKLSTQQGKAYAVFSPWNRNWTSFLSENMEYIEESSAPESNDSKKLKSDSKLQDYLKKNGKKINIPESVEGFKCEDSDYMSKLWPSGSKSALKVLDNFFTAKAQGTGEGDLEAPASEQGDGKESDIKKTRVGKYGDGRNIMSCNGTSRLSPYLTMGIISARHVLREGMKYTKKLNVGRDSGIAMFNTEISFRDFYGHVLSAFPRVCMGRCYVMKYEDVVWNYSDSELQAWKDGKTGYPIVDASMRQMKAQGYMHNRGRMIVSMFLTKHLMHDWREGEVHFMQNLIDCDFASNNGGWQWSASTGTDPQPYFRIFNPLSQSEKSDPDGEYIRHWVPELSKVKGKAIHAPHDRLDKKEFEKLGYPKPMVEHTFARKRALARFKEPGCADDE